MEDLLFYHHPPEQLRAERIVQLREFHWYPDKPDGEIEHDAIRPRERYYRPYGDRRRYRDDRRPRGRQLLDGMMRWLDNCSRGRSEHRDGGRRERRFGGTPSRRRRATYFSHSPPPGRAQTQVRDALYVYSGGRR
jgi:hypothetical protein